MILLVSGEPEQVAAPDSAGKKRIATKSLERSDLSRLKRAGFLPSLWEGLGEGAKPDARKPSPLPSPKGRGRKT
jgi:hypothetical protein